MFFCCFFVVCGIFYFIFFFFKKKKKKKKKKKILQEYHQSAKQFESRSGPTFCRVWSGSKLFAKFISRQQKSQPARKELDKKVLVSWQWQNTGSQLFAEFISRQQNSQPAGRELNKMSWFPSSDNTRMHWRGEQILSVYNWPLFRREAKQFWQSYCPGKC